MEKPPPAFRLRLCVPIVEEEVRRARRLYLRAARKGLWAELRLDYLARPDLGRLFRTLPGPAIVTNRPAAEGGRWQGTEEERRRLLEQALDFGVQALDVEWRTDEAWRREIFARRGTSRLIVSWHDFTGTPPEPVLRHQLEKLLAQEADIIKLVTFATSPEDNLRVLSLIPEARSRGREIIAFCMGPLGKWSRVAALFLGSFLAYAPIQARKTSAPGQLSVNEMRRLWKILRQ